MMNPTLKANNSFNTINLLSIPPVTIDDNCINILELECLINDFKRHLQSNNELVENDIQEQSIKGVCLSLMYQTAIPGLNNNPPSCLNDFYNICKTCRKYVNMPEINIVIFWLDHVIEGNQTVPKELFSITHQNIWPPVKNILFRLFSYYGLRSIEHYNLSMSTKYSLFQADAKLEIFHDNERTIDFINKIDLNTISVIDNELREKWLLLIKFELLLATKPESIIERDYLALLNFNKSSIFSYNQNEVKRLAGKAAAAIIRYRISSDQQIEDIVQADAFNYISDWEKSYLQGIYLWSIGRKKKAIATLKDAFQMNSFQTCIRYALSCILADSEAEYSLNMLNYKYITNEMNVLRSIIYLKKGHYDQSRKILLVNSNKPICFESVRYSWLKAKQQITEQEHILKSALYEHNNELQKASEVLKRNRNKHTNKTYLSSRLFYVLTCEFNKQSNFSGWKNSIVKQELKRLQYQLKHVVLSGDALFFYAVALANSSFDIAAKKFSTLLKQKRWVKAQLNSNINKIMYIGDMFLKHGHIKEAIQAYKIVKDSSKNLSQESYDFACLLEKIINIDLKQVKSSIIATTEKSNSRWFYLMDALHLILSKKSQDAIEKISLAIEQGSPTIISKFLISIANPEHQKVLSKAEEQTVINKMNISKELVEKIQFVCGTQTYDKKMISLIEKYGNNWKNHCPFDTEQVVQDLVCNWINNDQLNDAIIFFNQLNRYHINLKIDWGLLIQTCIMLSNSIQGNNEAAFRYYDKIKKSIK